MFYLMDLMMGSLTCDFFVCKQFFLSSLDITDFHNVIKIHRETFKSP